MSNYTTGELAKLCGVSVRTVQFYDTKGLLHPKSLTEGGRRLYCSEDLKQMQLICLFKSLGLSLDSIKQIMQSDYPANVLLLLLDEKVKQLDDEIEGKRNQMDSISIVRECVQRSEVIPENLSRDMELIMMENKKRKLARVRITMLALGIPCTILEVGSILLWIFKGIWLPFAIVMPAVIAVCIWLVSLYYKNTAYVCPECASVFKPEFKEFFFSRHTSKTRKLTCTSCHKKLWCVETYGGK